AFAPPLFCYPVARDQRRGPGFGEQTRREGYVHEPGVIEAPEELASPPIASTPEESGHAYDRHGQVVQRSKRLRFHHPGEWTEGLLRAPFRDPGPGVPDLGRGRAGRV